MGSKTNRLFDFITSSPTAFHAINTIKERLDNEGFVELKECDSYDIAPSGKYYVIRNNTSIVAFKIGKKLDNYSYKIVASHSDSPNFKLKENAQIAVRDKYTKLNTEGYGGMICSTWLDRPLSIAGRVIVRENGALATKLINFDRDLVMIPNMSIHMNRKVNEGFEYNKQVDMLPVISGKSHDDGVVNKLISDELGVNSEDILSSDLYLYNRMPATTWGMNDEFISSARLDDLECAFASLEGFVEGDNDGDVKVYACFDNEEVGSETKQGAGSTLLFDTLSRINYSLGKSKEEYHRAIASSFMLSCDNAHAVHPNHTEKTDETNNVYMNDGIVIKSHAGQKYTSDALSIAVFKEICKNADVPVQYFANRSDMVGGSTLGNIAMSGVSINCVDIGLAQLAMHSSYETAGAHDVDYMIKAVKEFMNSSITTMTNGNLAIAR